MDCSPPGSSVQGILQARILEWVTISSPRESLDPEIKLHFRQILCCLSYQAGGASGKEPACQCRRPKRLEFDSWVGKIPLKKEILSSILAWRILWTEEPGGLQSTGSQRVGHD